MTCAVKRQVFVDSCFLGYLPYLVVHILFSNKREDNIRRQSFIGTFGKPVDDFRRQGIGQPVTSLLLTDFNLVVVTHLLYISPSEFADIADTQTANATENECLLLQLMSGLNGCKPSQLFQFQVGTLCLCTLYIIGDSELFSWIAWQYPIPVCLANHGAQH